VIPSLPTTAYQYEVISSNGEVIQDLNDEIATLGRVLFYDEKLSANGSTSCGSCHHQDLGFADNKALSNGFRFATTLRNSMAIISPTMKSGFFWDSREDNLNDQVLLPIQNHIEMGINDFDALIDILQNTEYYPPLFEAAFGNGTVSEERISEALATFISGINPYNTKFDAGNSSSNSSFSSWESPEVSGLSVLEEKGMDLFFQEFRCVNCHHGRNFDGSGWNVANIGLDMEYADSGMASWTNNEINEGRFTVPSLRNLALTAPYMHDGRFATLEDVMNHYSSGIKPHPNLDWSLRVLPVDLMDFILVGNNPLDLFQNDLDNFPVQANHLNMSQDEKDALIAFLGTLNDHSFTHDPRFSDPFVLVD
jgi:cytochrome c peroxidase